MTRTVEKERVVIRIAGDSGDGMQLAGGRFTDATAVFGNDLATAPNYPAEVRAPTGTVRGVSSFQIHFASRDILTPGDRPSVLVAMNPAALKSNVDSLESGATILVNDDAFTARNLTKAGYDESPLEDGSLADFKVHRLPMTSLTVKSAEGIEGVTSRDAGRAKNLFALGVLSWMYARPLEVTEGWITKKFAKKPAVMAANLAAFHAGYNFSETTEILDVQYRIKPAALKKGTYRNVDGTTATALGLLAASHAAGVGLFFAGYPITPASELLHELARLRREGIEVVQAEDEIAAANMALGAAFGGRIGVTATSGPGMDLKAETIGLAVALELPMVVIDVQRAGPSTGMPTKPESSDLMMAIHGRHGESPLPVIAAATPAKCFDAAKEAVRLAIDYRTPVILLTDAFLANSSEPWRIPEIADIETIEPHFAEGQNDDGHFLPYRRDARGARPWAIPGTKGLAHRIGGLEKEDGTGNISYAAENHALMTRLRAEKVEGIAEDIPPMEIDHEEGAELVVLGWGSAYGPIKAGVRRVRESGGKVACANLTHVNPLPQGTGEALGAYRKVLVAETNMGQLAEIVRAKYLIDAESFTKVDGEPFLAAEMEAAIMERLER
jgi:2-oxoglutarate/2-oxoacid ferredoxin oxidoreductase subunit alpha